MIGNALAASDLANGRTVTAGGVSPVHESHQGWQLTAARSRSPLIERSSDVDGLVLPDRQAVASGDYSPWHEPHLIIGTAGLTRERNGSRPPLSFVRCSTPIFHGWPLFIQRRRTAASSANIYFRTAQLRLRPATTSLASSFFGQDGSTSFIRC